MSVSDVNSAYSSSSRFSSFSGASDEYVGERVAITYLSNRSPVVTWFSFVRLLGASIETTHLRFFLHKRHHQCVSSVGRFNPPALHLVLALHNNDSSAVVISGSIEIAFKYGIVRYADRSFLKSLTHAPPQ